ELGCDARRLEDDRQAAARMRAAADEVDAIEIFEAAARAEVEHLAEVVREVEGCTPVNLVLVFPIRRRDDALETDARFEIIEAELGELPVHQGAETIPFARPVHVRVLVRDRGENIKRALAGWSHRRVGDAWIFDIE